MSVCRRTRSVAFRLRRSSRFRKAYPFFCLEQTRCPGPAVENERLETGSREYFKLKMHRVRRVLPLPIAYCVDAMFCQDDPRTQRVL